ncbi:MAG: SDR family oxidoreductase [Candidatus Heimdallarchaeota archaeon]|nr:MAG: SDR family oxidoreductase [Candidatus Heimdallarchaeota archaeon]
MNSKNVLDLFKLTGRVALVTGGAKGVGTVINEGLLEAGVTTLIFCGRGRHGSLDDERNRLSESFPSTNIHAYQCDISDESQVKSMIQNIKKEVGGVDILINNAGVTWNAPTVDQTLATWHRVLDINLTGLFLITREVANELMIPKSGGTIINISSILAFQGIAVGSQIGYTASKAGVLGLTRHLAIEWSKWNIRVNAIAPSFIEGDTMAKVFTSEDSPMRETLLESVPLKHFNHPNDIKSATCFLASDASSNITGQYLVLDGGLSVK